MTPNSALFAFTVFIAAGFYVEYRSRRAPVTSAVWLPLFWMAICASRSISQWLGVSMYRKTYADDATFLQANLNGSPADRAILTLVIVAGLIIMARRPGTLGEIVRRNKVLLAFVIYMGVTVLWSDIAGTSFKRWIRLFGHVVMAGVIVSEPAPVEAVRSLFRRCAYLLLPLSVMLIKYFPNIGVLYFRKGDLLWIGAAVMKNGLGHLALVFTFVLLWELITLRSHAETSLRRRLLFDVIVIVMGFWLLRGPGNASSSAAIGSLIAGTALLLFSRTALMRKTFTKSGVLIVTGVIVFGILESTLGIVEIIVASLGRDMTFTDRVPLWGVLIDIGMQQPLTGYGYSGFWTAGRLDSIVAVAGEFNQAHNGYMEIFVEGGLIAIALLAALLVSVFRKIERTGALSYDYATFRLAMFLIILLANVTESSFARERDLLTITFFVIAMADVFPKSGVLTATDSPSVLPASAEPSSLNVAARARVWRPVERSIHSPVNPAWRPRSER